MKDLGLLTWLTQLGLSVTIPPVILILSAVWLRNHFGWGVWCLWVAIGLSLYCAVTGLIGSLQQLSRFAKKDEKEKEHTVSFNDHD